MHECHHLVKSPRHSWKLYAPKKELFEFSSLLHLLFPSREFVLRLPVLCETRLWAARAFLINLRTWCHDCKVVQNHTRKEKECHNLECAGIEQNLIDFVFNLIWTNDENKELSLKLRCALELGSHWTKKKNSDSSGPFDMKLTGQRKAMLIDIKFQVSCTLIHLQ